MLECYILPKIQGVKVIKFPLFLLISFSNYRSRFSQSEIEFVEEILALSYAYAHAVVIHDVPLKNNSVPEVLMIVEIARTLPDIPVYSVRSITSYFSSSYSVIVMTESPDIFFRASKKDCLIVFQS